MRNSMLWNFRKASLHFLFWGGCVLYAIEIVPAFTSLRPHTTVFVSIFSISCLLMILDFKILRFNAWIYAHHFIMFAICAAVWAYFCSPDYNPNDAFRDFGIWGIICTNTSWSRQVRWFYAGLNVIMVSMFTYFFDTFARSSVTSLFFIPMMILIAGNVVVSMIVSYKLLLADFRKRKRKSQNRRADSALRVRGRTTQAMH